MLTGLYAQFGHDLKAPPIKDVYTGSAGNARRVGHDISPVWSSMISLIDLGAGLWPYAHNGSLTTFKGGGGTSVHTRAFLNFVFYFLIYKKKKKPPRQAIAAVYAYVLPFYADSFAFTILMMVNRTTHYVQASGTTLIC